MFGKKKVFNNAQKSELADGLATVLSIQMVVAGAPSIEVTKIELKKGNINRKAIGYIYGFVDCALQSRGEDITNISVGLPIVYHVMRKLFPGHEQTYVDFLMHHMDDEVVVLGMLTGGQQYSEFIHAKGTPMGLARFILESRDQED